MNSPEKARLESAFSMMCDMCCPDKVPNTSDYLYCIKSQYDEPMCAECPFDFEDGCGVDALNHLLRRMRGFNKECGK